MIETAKRKICVLPKEKSKSIPLFILGKAAVYLAVYSLSGLSVADEIYPFGISILFNLTLRDMIPGMIFSILGFWRLGKSSYLPGYMASIVIGFMLRMIFFQNEKGFERFSPIAALFSSALPRVIIGLFAESDIYYWITSAAESLLTGAGTYFFSYAKTSFLKSPVCSGKKDNISAIFFISVLITALMNVNILRINLGTVLSSFIICSFAYTKGEAYSCLAGAALTAAWVIIRNQSSVFTVIYPISGLFAGIFRKFGKSGTACACAFTYLMLISAGASDKIPLIVGTILGTGIFIFTPSDRIQDFIGGYSDVREENQIKYICLIIKNRLCLLSEALSEIRKTTDTVSAVKIRNSLDKYDMVYNNVCEKYCQYCPNNISCWQKNYSLTVCIIDGLINKLKQDKDIFPSDYPEYFKKTCNSYMDISEAVEDGYTMYLHSKKNRRQLEALRGVVTQQLEGISGMVKALSDSLDNIYRSDLYLQNRIYDYFSHRKIQLNSCFCFYDKWNIMTVQIETSLHKAQQCISDETVLDLSDLCERNLSSPKITKQNDFARITYCENARYRVKTAFIQKHGEKDDICGDSIRQVENCENKACVILSDGMGTGREASLESTMTTDMLCDLILRGGDPENAVKIINSALICKAVGECMATVDISIVDLYTGMLEIYKSAAAPTYLLKGGKASYVSASSLPLGIIKNIKTEKFAFNLNEGDMVINLTDGATESGEDWIISQLESLRDNEPQEIAEKLYDTAVKRKCGKYLDDITISVLKLEKA